MNHVITSIAFTSLLTMYFGSMAQTTQIGMELRVRPEVRHGYRFYPDSSSESAVLIDQRLRLNIRHEQEKFILYGSLQEARTWGEEEQAKDVPVVGVHEAWGQLNFNKSISLKAGRQELRYDDEKLLGNADWLAQARSHDAAVLKVAFGKNWKLDVGGAFNQSTQNFFGTYYPLNGYKTLEYAWLEKSIKDSVSELRISAILIGDGYQQPDSSGLYTRVTLGGNMDYSKDDWKIHFSVYDQLGKESTGKEINAYFFSLYGSLNLDKKWNITAGAEYLSGTNQLDSANVQKQRTFSTLYSSNHPYYGIADYFLNIPTDTRNGGLIDGYLKVSHDIKKVKLFLSYHYLMLQNNVVANGDVTKALDKYLGSEIDAWGTYSFVKDVSILFGGSLIMGTESMTAIKGGNAESVGAWMYAGVSFKPTLLSKQP